MTDKSLPTEPATRHPETAKDTGFFYADGRPVPPTHPDHGPMENLPRQADGSFAAYYYCSKEELAAAEVDRPPARRQRHDGWTPDRIERFLEALRSTASIKDACRIVGMSRQSAYNLYNREESAHIRKAWDEALRACTNVLATTAFDRAVNGTEEQVYYKGEFVGWRDRYDNRHLQWMLRVRDPLNWAPLTELEGWMRQRGLEKPEAIEPSLRRLTEAEEEWSRRLPGEEGEPPATLPEPAEDRGGNGAEDEKS
ncbi:hypothetical protein HFP57_02650 [Parasphingopyxis algicola]|uniref:hypothetical protein n=1 Tax=Parasphingopyxis algicola TaxID=2026624 RepID=UPI0015A4D38F|nr:hypothetical protein [Parasphingopyxis algicola]QLC24038.1 hypothetical protein HFP57_02650 [Parasphingopyxis algicola]